MSSALSPYPNSAGPDLQPESPKLLACQAVPWSEPSSRYFQVEPDATKMSDRRQRSSNRSKTSCVQRAVFSILLLWPRSLLAAQAARFIPNLQTEALGHRSSPIRPHWAMLEPGDVVAQRPVATVPSAWAMPTRKLDKRRESKATKK